VKSTINERRTTWYRVFGSGTRLIGALICLLLLVRAINANGHDCNG